MVYRVQHEDLGPVVYKKYRSVRSSDWEEEAAIQRRLDHPNIVRLIAVVSEPDAHGLVLEYLEYGDILDYIQTYPTECTPIFKYSRMREISSGMRYLHSLHPPIIHGDLKAGNVLLGKNKEAKICDFGFAKVKLSSSQPQSSTLKGTWTHIPPESWINPNLRKKESFDIYSFAIMMWEIITVERPFQGARSLALIREWVLKNCRPDLELIPSEISENIKDLMIKCWDKNPNDRPTFGNICDNFREILDS